jgi:hypothetical protein
LSTVADATVECRATVDPGGLGFSAANLQWEINGSLIFGGLPAARRPAGRPVRAAPAVPVRRRDLLVRLAAQRLATSDTWLVAARELQGLGAFDLLLGGVLSREWIFLSTCRSGSPPPRSPSAMCPSRGPRCATAASTSQRRHGHRAVVVLVYAFVKAEDFGWGSGRTLGLAAVALAPFVPASDRRHRRRSRSSS